MIDYNKIAEYAATMISKVDSCNRLTAVAFDELFGVKGQPVTEKDLHACIEYLIARSKKEVEENSCATTERKELEKNRREQVLQSFEEWINSYLQSQNRLI